MKNAEKSGQNWNEIKERLKTRWNISENELIQASGIPELANTISRKVGEPRPNILHELIDEIRSINPDHPMLKDYFQNTMGSGDDGNRLAG